MCSFKKEQRSACDNAKKTHILPSRVSAAFVKEVYKKMMIK